MDKSTNISLTIPEIVNIITTINMVVMFAILFFRRNNSLPNKILALILLLPGIAYINNFLILSNSIHQFPSIVFITQISALIVAPLIYQYTGIFMGKKRKLGYVWHSSNFVVRRSN